MGNQEVLLVSSPGESRSIMYDATTLVTAIEIGETHIFRHSADCQIVLDMSHVDKVTVFRSIRNKVSVLK